MALRAHPVRAALAPPAAFDLAANEKPRPGTVTVNGRSVPLHAPGAVHGKELAHAGIRVYDPGFAHTLSCTSSITQIDGAVGTLLHRGYSLESLPGACVYTEVVHLLLRGALPSATQHAQFLALLHGSATPPPAARAVVSTAPRSAHPMGVLVSALAAAGASMDGLNPSRTPRVYDSASQRLRAVSAILGGFPALAAGVMRRARGERVCFPPLPATADRWESARRFLWLVDSDLVRGKIGERRVRAVDALLTVHADHEQNCSTATLRQLASSGVDVFSAVAGATAALYGPLHGGASESVVRMLRRVGSVERVPAFLERVKRREERLMGFGHR